MLFLIKLFMEFKENVLDRIEQTFVFMKNNFNVLVLPLIIFYVLVYLFFCYGWIYFVNFVDTNNIYSPTNMYLIIGVVLFILIYLILDIWIILSLFKTIKDIDEENDFTISENYKYWFLNILESFKTYFYIFMYVYFIPSLIFIIVWIYFIYIQMGNILNDSLLAHISNFIWIWVVLFLWLFIYIIYRSYKVVFAIPSAVSKGVFDKENFKYSVSLTKWNWWRIVWNFLLVWIIIWILTYIINMPFESHSIFDTMSKNFNNLDINKIIQEFNNSKISTQSIIQDVVWRLIMTIVLLFTSIFTYIFFKRLEVEKSSQETI